MLPRIGAVLLLSLSSASAQGAEWLVDAANGPGTHFTDLQTALAAPQVRDGDRLLVRPGTYGPCQTAKGVAILGQPGVVIQSAGGPAVTVAGLPAQRTFVLHRVTIQHVFTAAGVSLQSDAGHVHLGEINFWSVSEKHALEVSACSLVSVHRCHAPGSSRGFVSVDADVIVAETTVAGLDQAATFQITRTPAIAFARGTLWLSQVTATGGAGYSGSIHPVPPAPGIEATQATVILAGTGTVSAGTRGATLFPAGAIHLAQSTLTYSPTVVLVPFAGAPTVILDAGSSTRRAALPYLIGTAGPPSGMLQLTLHTARNDQVFLAVGLPAAPTALPFGVTWLDLGTLVPLVVGPQASGQVTLQLPVPVRPELRGAVFAFQAANAAAATGELRTTNPLFLPLH